MVYNIYFEAASLAFLVILNVYIRLLYPSDSVTNRRFKRLALVLTAAIALDLITATTISYYASVPVWINMLLNFWYFSADIVLEYQFVNYCMYCVFEKEKPAVIWSARAVVALAMILLIVNFYTGWVFYFNSAGYQHGPLYYIVYIIPYAAMIVSNVILFMGFPKFRKNQRICVAIYLATALAGPVVQIVWPNVLFSLFSVALGFVLLSFSMETPDFQELNRTMKELRRTRDEAEEAMADAQRANEAKSQFLTGVSHEIRTPINAIMGYAESIRRDSEKPDIIKQSENVMTAGKRLLSMVNDIMSYSEMESGTFALEEGEYATSSFLMDIIAGGEYYAEKKNLKFTVDVDENIPSKLYGDSARLMQAADNLLSNAVKYTKEGSVELTVGWEYGAGGCGEMLILVKDTGIGMKEEDAARVSTSFIRFDHEQTHDIQGLGLGLAIVTRILGAMNSKLEIKSEYGKGSEIGFRVVQKINNMTPLGKLKKADKSAVIKGAGFRAPNARLLAVDDNQINLEIICRSVSDTKISVDTAVNGAEALGLIKERHYDVIFLDHMMPILDGVEALKIIRRERLCPETPIIVVTANAVSGEREMYLAAGFDDYVSKPVTSRKLCEVLKKYLPPELVEEVEEEAPAEEESVDENAEASEFSKKFGFLNTEKGLAYCCDDEDFYLQIIKSYIEEDKTDGIMKALEEGDMEEYRIQVHALKGTSRTIGAEAFGEEAAKLEAAARGKEEEYIKQNNARVMKEYKELLKQLENAALELERVRTE